jgi:hypothetical protein
MLFQTFKRALVNNYFFMYQQLNFVQIFKAKPLFDTSSVIVAYWEAQ